MDNAIRVERDMIALEARNPSNTLQALTKRLPNFVANIKEFISSALSNQSPEFEFVHSKKLEKLFKEHKYAQVSHLGVFIPPGLQVTYLEYIEALETALAVTTKLQSETVGPFQKFVAEILTSPEKMQSLRNSPQQAGVILHDLETAKEQISKCFNPNASNSKATYGDVVDRHRDVSEITERLNAINEQMSRIDRKELVKEVEETAELLDTLLERIRKNPEEYQVSGNTLDTLVQAIYQVGEEVEFYSVFSYQVQGLTQAVKDSYERLDKVLRT